MRRRWIGAALMALGLVGRAPAQMPMPPGGGMPMSPPTFANDPTPMPGPQFCPPGGAEPPASPFSLPNDGSPNAFSCDQDCACEHPGCYLSIGWMALLRQPTGNGVLAVRDPGVNIPGIPPNVDSGLFPPQSAPQLLGFNDITPRWLNGIRAFLTYREDGHAFEIGGFYMFQQVNSAVAIAPGRLDLPFANFPLPIGFQGDNNLWLQADQVRAALQTQLASAEANYRTSYCRGFEWIFGVRYLFLQERFSVTTDDDSIVDRQAGRRVNLTEIATVSARTSNNIVAPQLGFEWEKPLVSWLTVGMTGKGAWGANFLTIDSGLQRFDSFPGPSFRHTSVIFSQIYELSAWGTIFLTEQCRLKAGYMALWVTGVPQAQQQFSFDLGNPGLNVGANNHSSVLFHGPMVELQFAF